MSDTVFEAAFCPIVSPKLSTALGGAGAADELVAATTAGLRVGGSDGIGEVGGAAGVVATAGDGVGSVLGSLVTAWGTVEDVIAAEAGAEADAGLAELEGLGAGEWLAFALFAVLVLVAGCGTTVAGAVDGATAGGVVGVATSGTGGAGGAGGTGGAGGADCVVTGPAGADGPEVPPIDDATAVKV